MKKLFVVLLCMCLLAGLAACGPTREEIAEARAEEMLEEMSGDEIDIDVDDGGDTVTIKSEDGDVVIEGSEGGQPWPAGDVPSYVPEVNGAKIIGTMKSGTGIMIIFEDCPKAQAEAYKGAMVAAGWNIQTELEMEGDLVYIASKGDSESLTFSWSGEDGSGGVTYGAEQ